MAVRGREQLLQYFPKTLEGTATLESTVAYLHFLANRREAGEICHFVGLEAQRLIGFYFIKSIDIQQGKAEIGYFTEPGHQGKGIATAAVQVLLDYCWDELKLNKVYLRVAPENRSSIRVAEKAGFQREGLLRQDFRTSTGTFVDIFYYGILRQECRS